jgi:hypothetical protein
MSVSHRSLFVLAAIAFLLFAAIVLNSSIERDSLSCEPARCVADRERFVAFSGPSGPREFRPQDVKKVEVVAKQMRYGSVWLFEIAGQDDLVLRLVMDDTQAYDLRRWLEAPTGRVAFEGPRATRNYPFVALLCGLAAAAFIVAVKGRKKE